MRMALRQTGPVSGKPACSLAVQVTMLVDRITRPSAQARAFHWNSLPAVGHRPDPCHLWPVIREGRDARWSRLDPIALRSRRGLAIYGWIEREPCGMTETGTCDRLVKVLNPDTSDRHVTSSFCTFEA